MALNDFNKRLFWRLAGIAFLMLVALAGTALAGRAMTFHANASFLDIRTQRIIAVIGAAVIIMVDILLAVAYWLRKRQQKMQTGK